MTPASITLHSADFDRIVSTLEKKMLKSSSAWLRATASAVMGGLAVCVGFVLAFADLKAKANAGAALEPEVRQIRESAISTKGTIDNLQRTLESIDKRIERSDVLTQKAIETLGRLAK